MGHNLPSSREAYFAPEWEKKIREAYNKVQWNRERIIEVQNIGRIILEVNTYYLSRESGELVLFILEFYVPVCSVAEGFVF